MAHCMIHVFDLPLSVSIILRKACSTLDVSNPDISKYPLVSQTIVRTHFLFLLGLNSLYIKLLISQSKFSETIKFTQISVVWDELRI